MWISIDVSAEEIEALAQLQLSEDKKICLFVDKVLRDSARVSVQNIAEARKIQEVNPYFSSYS